MQNKFIRVSPFWPYLSKQQTSSTTSIFFFHNKQATSFWPYLSKQQTTILLYLENMQQTSFISCSKQATNKLHFIILITSYSRTCSKQAANEQQTSIILISPTSYISRFWYWNEFMSRLQILTFGWIFWICCLLILKDLFVKYRSVIRTILKFLFRRPIYTLPPHWWYRSSISIDRS